MAARDAIARLRRNQAHEPSSRELLLPRRHARILVGQLGDDAPVEGPPLDYDDEPLPFEARPMFDLCKAMLIGMVASHVAVLVWLYTRT